MIQGLFNSMYLNSRGLFNNKFGFQLDKRKKDTKGNLLAIYLNVNNNRITLINYMVPIFSEKIREYFMEFDDNYFTLCRDKLWTPRTIVISIIPRQEIRSLRL
jgi:hypothetical protein